MRFCLMKGINNNNDADNDIDNNNNNIDRRICRKLFKSVRALFSVRTGPIL